MCGRVGLGKEQRYAIDQRYDLVLGRLNVQRKYNVPPSGMLPLVYEVDGEPQAVMARWGLKPFWWKKGPPPSNARFDSIRDGKPAFRSAFKSRRGFIPVDHFYEWHATPAGKQPYLFQRADCQPLLMAALWEPGEGDAPFTTTIITTDANEWMAPVHHRMPYILEPHELAAWMNADTPREELLAMMQPGADGILERYAVSTLVNKPIEDARVVERVEEGVVEVE